MSRKTVLILWLSIVVVLTPASFAQEGERQPDNVLYVLERGTEPYHYYAYLSRTEFYDGQPTSPWPVLNLREQVSQPPVITPNGDSIYLIASPPFAYSESGYLPNQIYSVTPLGYEFKSISPDDRYFRAISFAPDGSQFAVGTNPVTDAIAYGLALMDAGGSNRRELPVPYDYFSWATWSPDGTQIAIGNYLSSTVLFVDVTSGEITRQFDIKLPAAFNVINWGADSEKVYFTGAQGSEPTGAYSIYEYAVGSDTLSVFDEDLRLTDSSVVLSPDRTKLAAYTYGEERTYNLMVIDIDSGGIVQEVELTSYSFEVEDGPLAWSPDGEMIAFPQRIDDDGLISQVFVLNVESGEVQQVTYSENGAAHPMWLPE